MNTYSVSIYYAGDLIDVVYVGAVSEKDAISIAAVNQGLADSSEEWKLFAQETE